MSNDENNTHWLAMSAGIPVVIVELDMIERTFTARVRTCLFSIYKSDEGRGVGSRYFLGSGENKLIPARLVKANNNLQFLCRKN